VRVLPRLAAPRLAAWTLLVAACGSSGTTTPDGGGDDVDGPASCERPSLDDAAYSSFVSSALSALPAPRGTVNHRSAARDHLIAELTDLGWSPTLHDYPTGANVIATIPPAGATSMTGNGQGIVLGAHFDTVTNSPGANDNGSGTAVVLAVARILVDVPCRTAPVTIAFFDEEEVGLRGSRAFAQTLSTGNIRAVHTIDQVAFDDDNDRRFELEAGPQALDAEWRAAAQVIGVPVTSVPTEGTDHEAFRDAGFPAIGLTEEFVGGDTSPHRHLASDTVATVKQSYLQLAMKLTAQVVIEQISP
jgi:hypothetical protein